VGAPPSIAYASVANIPYGTDELDIAGGLQGAPVEVVFSKAESADDTIKRMVADAPRKKNMVVVTDDRDIQYAVRAHGAKVKTPAEFFASARPSRSSRAGKADRPHASLQEAKHIPKVLEYEINAELEKIWVKDKKDK